MAAPQQKGSNSILEGLSGVMSQLAALSVLPDAQPHVPFVNSLMSEIQKYLHKPQVGGMALGAPPGAGGPPGMGGGPPPGAEGPPGAPPMGAPPQGMQNMQPPTPSGDELRRLLTTAGRSA